LTFEGLLAQSVNSVSKGERLKSELLADEEKIKIFLRKK
jgi:hypothetical protein